MVNPGIRRKHAENVNSRLNATDRRRHNMRLKSSLVAIGLALGFAVVSPTVARADPLGSQVTATLFYPTETAVFSGPIGPLLVTSAVEFPAGTLAFDGSLDVSGSKIIWT